MPEIPVVLPQWGQSMEDATLVEWLVDEGGRVEREQAIAVVETDKVDAEVTAPEAGTLRRLVEPDQQVAVGTTIATITTG
jgi:pyruvate/2-oxoglutarate dehydrogenase complex dihydrolipoamide acyltransferase (E2) component